MARRTSPTIRRWQLGQELAAARAAADMRVADAARAIEVSGPTLSKIENGKQQIKPLYVRVLAALYGVDDDTRDRLLEMAAEANQPEWYVAMASQVPKWFRQYLGYEAVASEIRTYTVELVDGLMQTEEYARALALAGSPEATDRDLDGYVAVRRGRQARLVGEQPPRLHTILNEAALRCAFDRDVRRGQLERILELAGLPHVTVQVLRPDAGPHPGMTSGFTLLGFDEHPAMGTVYIENGRGAVYLDAKADLDQYTWKFDRIAELALTPQKSRDLLTRLLADV